MPANYNKLERIALGRGTFGPPTKAHMNNGEQMINQLDAKLVHFAAKPKPEHKKGVIDIEHRHNMLLRATQKFDKINALRVGVKLSLKKTVNNLKLVHPNAELIVFQGDDVFEYLQKANGAAMKSLAETGASIAVMPRNKTYEELVEMAEIVKFAYGVDVYVLENDGKMKDISSLNVINNIQNKEYLREVLPEGVSEYIWEHNLWNANGLPPLFDEEGFEIQPSGIYARAKKRQILMPDLITPASTEQETKKDEGIKLD